MSEGSMTDPAPTPDRAAMMQALEALCLDAGGEEQIRIEADAIAALRAALALPAPAEPARSSPFSQQQVSGLVERLRACAEDPMWADHAEAPKTLCAGAADMLEELALLADSEGTRAVNYLRRARAAEAAAPPQPVQPPATAQPVQPPGLQDIEQYRLQMAGICTAALGYWKEGDGIHPDYDTPALRDVAKLYAKYDALYKAAQPPATAQPVQPRSDGMPASADERKLRRMYAVRVGMPGLYTDDGEASGSQHGISIDFMREPVADVAAKVMALEVARYECATAQPVQAPPMIAVPGAVWGMYGEDGVCLIQRGTEDERIAKNGGERLYRMAAPDAPAPAPAKEQP